MIEWILIATTFAAEPTVPVPATATGSFVPAPAPAEIAPAAEPPSVEPRHIFLRYLDRDRDRRLSSQEIPQKLQRAFTKTDANGDGYLDENEILYASTRIGQQARKLENLKVTRDGQLAARGPGNEILVTTGVRLLGRLDTNGDHELQSTEIGAAVASPATLAQAAASAATEAVDAQRSSQSLAADADSPNPASSSKEELPTAEQILENLDRNSDGVVDPSEAVDQLADNFQRLDKDKSGGLDLFEIDRGLRLARLFGIKPKKDPKQYQKATPAPPPESAPAAGATGI